jgi:hypothetical protein
MRADHVLAALLPLLLLSGPAASAGDAPSLDRGYAQMYALDFRSSAREFLEWQRQHPDDPLGPMSEAANLLFSELERLRILQAQFFVEDSSFTARRRRPPDPALHERFEAALGRCEALAGKRLSATAEDRDALFAMALVNGLRADYAALVEGRNFASLSYTRQAAAWAARVLALSPDYWDAYLATGISQYIVGSLPAPVRWFLRIGGYHGDREKGLKELQLAAERGRFLAPFARILLAIAYLREGDKPRARELLVGLRRDFPSNPLFAREIRRLDGEGD